jgi:deazaflavin-dependent oxidoreductase (nitroreductase family)
MSITSIATTPATTASPRYLAPTKADLAFSRLALRLTRWGLSFRNSRELTVIGRRSGLERSTLVNLLELDGARYLVAPRGTTDWVRNVRAAGGGTLRLGRQREAFTARELSDDEKVPVLRAYLEQWAFEVGRFFEGVDAQADDEALAAIAADHPVFELR